MTLADDPFAGVQAANGLPDPPQRPSRAVRPLISLDDPFPDVADEDLFPNSSALQESYVLRLLVEDFSRGMYSVGRIREKYLGFGDRKPFPWLTSDRLAELMTQAAVKMVNDNPLDMRMEISGYLAANLGLQETLYVMVDDTLAKNQNRSAVEIIRLINQMKNERMHFVEHLGHELIDAENNPNSILPPGVIPVTDLLACGEVIIERTKTPDRFKGVLASGDLAQDGGDGGTTPKVENKQDPVYPAGFISG